MKKTSQLRITGEHDCPPKQVRVGDVVVATLRDIREIGAPSLHMPALVCEVLEIKQQREGAESLAPIAAVLFAGATVQSVAMVPDAHGRPSPFPLVSASFLTYSTDQTPQTWCWPEEHKGGVVTPHLSEAH